MGNQRTFASVAWQAKGKATRHERFLAEMDAVIPWTRLLALCEAHYPKAGQGGVTPINRRFAKETGSAPPGRGTQR